MRQELFIQSAVALSPQLSFDRKDFLKPAVYQQSGKLFAIDIEYRNYISPVAIRRMSRIMKMTISTAMEALKAAGVSSPDAIITGTGRGGVTDMEHFVKDMIRMDEGPMNPTQFIQSTYNSPNGWIAMQSNSTGYNQTYVHRGSSFELALLDAQMMSAETDLPLNILAGCFDELTEEYYFIRGKRGYWKRPAIPTNELYIHGNTPGTIAGEGTAFFVLSNQAGKSVAKIVDLKILYNARELDVPAMIKNTLDEAGLKPEDISLVLMGDNGDCRQGIYYQDLSTIFPDEVLGRFKHLSGEYDTAMGFAVWLADHIIRTGEVPEACQNNRKSGSDIKHILILNHYILGTASILLMSRTFGI